MSFFGFDHGGLEKAGRTDGLQEREDLTVYTYGEESYDGLADTLQEGGDELNDETFGSIGKVGKDFDFGQSAFLVGDKPLLPPSPRMAKESELRQEPASQSQSSRAPTLSLEAIWDDKSPFSVFGRANGAAASRPQEPPQPSSRPTFSPFEADETLPISHQQPITHGVTQTGARTLQDIELEMRAAAAAQQQPRLLAERQIQQQQQQQQQQLRMQQIQQQQLLLKQQEQFRQERILQMQQQQQQQQHQEQFLRQTQRSPSSRMLPASQPHRVHERQQRQLMLLQQQQDLQQQRAQELQEQRQMEEFEMRQLRAQQYAQWRGGNSGQILNTGPIPNTRATDLMALPTAAQQHRRSPSTNDLRRQVAFQQSPAYVSKSAQMQQRLLAEMAQVDYPHGSSVPDPEVLRTEAVRKIMETERMEEKRRRKAAKISHMSRYNDLMTQSDKDFITRIQVSQLVTSDPYADDFYAQVYGAILRSRLGLLSQEERVLKFGSSGGVGLGPGQRGGGRRPSAMQRMEAQVERIVSNARLREKEKGLHSLHSLQGVLGKTSGRSYKAAPRQLLQVDPSTTPAHAHISKDDAVNKTGDGAIKEAAKLGKEALGNTDSLVRKEPLSHRQILSVVESMYDLVLKVEQLRRDQPLQEDIEAFETWEKAYLDIVQELWDGLRVMVPLETSDPHPFISILTPTKGKKLLPRLTRHFSSQQLHTMLTLLVACFNQLDVVRYAPTLDSLESPDRKDRERQTQAFLGSVLQSILPVVAKASLRLVSGLLGLLLDRNDIVVTARTRPGLALLTLFLSRVEVIKQSLSVSTDPSEAPTAEEALQWKIMLDHLFDLFIPHLVHLFPTPQPLVSPGKPTAALDQPVWQFLAALALHASTEQQQVLVATLREKILDDYMVATKGWVEPDSVDEEERTGRLNNINLFLHALGLDSSQITL